MSQLEDDISKLADEAFTKKDAKAALAIVGEVVGLGAVAYVGAIVISAIFGPGGVMVASAGAAREFMLKSVLHIVIYQEINAWWLQNLQKGCMEFGMT